MSCGPLDARFRLLDTYVGWSVDGAGANGLAGLDEPAGLHLAAQDADAVGTGIWRRLLPPRLARCRGALLLLTPAPARLLRRDGCHADWQPRWTPACQPSAFGDPVALAACGEWLALLDRGTQRIIVWRGCGDRVLAEIALPGAQAIGYTACGELLAVADGQLHRYGPAGDSRGMPVALAAVEGRALLLAGDMDGGVWLVTRQGSALRLWHADAVDLPFASATLAQLLAAPLADTGVAAVGEEGFCLNDSCWTWYGRSLDSVATSSPALQHDAIFTTSALDSGMPRCRWHRVQLDADIPPGCYLRVQVASADHADASVHDDDWQQAPDNALDFLIDQPPGRYLFVRIALHGDGASTPLLRRARFDFPRSTSLDSLPAVYRDNPRAEHFTERFLSLFDASMLDLDDAIGQFPAAIDVASARTELLPWLAGMLDLVFDPAWDGTRQRAILAALPRLYRARGTGEGMRLAIRLLFDTDVVLEELAFERAWGAVGRDSALGAVRLFGRARARFSLGASSLGAAPLKSYGDPDRDAPGSSAYRFRVLVPPSPHLTARAMQRLLRLVESQKPAHTQVVVRGGGAGFMLGISAAIGIDSVLGPLAAPRLGADGNVRLGRMSVLWPGRRHAASPFVLGRPVVAGIQTLLE